MGRITNGISAVGGWGDRWSGVRAWENGTRFGSTERAFCTRETKRGTERTEEIHKGREGQYVLWGLWMKSIYHAAFFLSLSSN